ncbi:unnamed protein product [Mesocestoides corti]|uniref:C3H1-type domain-containing protein n=1 Tax=Mesocestoides corti TaxID=53468 RepID=A0A0R3URA2_MESCO|nr:unnamed protein product [Mesocestoides corti]
MCDLLQTICHLTTRSLPHSQSNSETKSSILGSSAREFATWKGEACKFAHSILELRAPQNHPKYRTKPCVIYTITGACPFGVRCFFVHRNNPPSTMVFRDNASLNYSL